MDDNAMVRTALQIIKNYENGQKITDGLTDYDLYRFAKGWECINITQGQIVCGECEPGPTD